MFNVLSYFRDFSIAIANDDLQLAAFGAALQKPKRRVKNRSASVSRIFMFHSNDIFLVISVMIIKMFFFWFINFIGFMVGTMLNYVNYVNFLPSTYLSFYFRILLIQSIRSFFICAFYVNIYFLR